MSITKNHTETSYKISIWILYLLAFAIATVILNNDPRLSRILFGLPILTSGVLGIIGSIAVVKGFEEPANEKRTFAMLVNFGMVLLTLAILLSNTVYS
ncbi:hypothetical protein [Costertonia aggregata]|uniref:Uncharacterized protein n=1 Tax=Costertonia aggregata TaxID=343403 RepID=A0A7H9ATS8_9FLAO|nr:hypothetical protein [Costertonia aggregata]QLG46826.1 hypothetical protein HYG79_16195 [Costertonia aggregata]